MIQAHPLQWPQGWPRTTSRKHAQFGRNETVHSQHGGSYQQKRTLSIEDGVRRVRAELAKLGVDDTANDMVVSTNLKLNLAGLPRGDQGAPSEPGVAVYWQKKN